MGKKKSSQQHLQQSMGQMVSNAALARLGPKIEELVSNSIKRLGSQLAMQQASTLEILFSRVVVLETILMEKFGFTAEDLANRVSDVEDEKEGFDTAVTVEKGDLLRVSVRTKTKDQPEFQGESRNKIYDVGSGQTIGPELETPLIGLKVGDVKTVEFGKDKEMTAEFTINKISRPVKEIPNEGDAQGK